MPQRRRNHLTSSCVFIAAFVLPSTNRTHRAAGRQDVEQQGLGRRNEVLRSYLAVVPHVGRERFGAPGIVHVDLFFIPESHTCSVGRSRPNLVQGYLVCYKFEVITDPPNPKLIDYSSCTKSSNQTKKGISSGDKAVTQLAWCSP